MTTAEAHPDIEELIAWGRRQLPRRRSRQILTHCRECPECDLMLAKILVLMMEKRRKWIRQRRRRRRLQAAAAFLLLVGAGTVFLGARMSGHGTDPTHDLAALATTETIPESHVGLRFRLATPASPGGYDSEFKAGMEALVREDYLTGVEILERLHASHPSETEISTYLGVARYLSGDDSGQTRALLARGTNHHQDMIRRTAAWYLANSCLRSGDVDAAIQILQTPDLIGTDTRYGRYSTDLLRRINEAGSE